MKNNIVTYFCVAMGLVCCLCFNATASVLTFDQFTDDAKTIRVPVSPFGAPPIQEYGDNITDFSPAGPVGGRYVDYGPAGGYTPNITVAYRWYDPLDPTNLNPNPTGAAGGSWLWDTGYGSLQHVIFASPRDANQTRWLSQVEFTPEPGYQVTINSLDFAGFRAAQSGQTLKIVANANSLGAQVLWSAGADGSVNFPATATTLSPIVTGAPGQTVSILWGFSELSGLDNIEFSQSAIPEAASVVVWLGLALTGTVVRTRHR